MKRTILKIAVVTLALMTAGGTAYAGGPKGGHGHGRGDGHRMERRLEKMSEHLELSEAQQAEVRKIMEAAKAERKTLREANQGDRDAKRAAMKELRQRTRAQIDAVLTPEQRQKAESFRAEMKERHRGKGERGHHGKRHHRKGKMIRAALRGLDLTEEQKEAIKELGKQAREDVRDIVEEQHGGDWKAAREDVKLRREQLEADVKAQLTAEQVVKFEENLAEMEAKRAERRGKRQR